VTFANPRWIARLLVLLAVGASIYVVAAVWAGSTQTSNSIERIGVVSLLVGTVAASSSYLARFARWQVILACLGHRLPMGFGLRTYLAGLALTTSPAKLGETLRSVILLGRGVPVPRSLAAFFADRLADVIGVALLGATAGLVGGDRQPILEAIAVAVFLGAATVAALIRSRHWQRAVCLIGHGRRSGLLLAAIAAPASAWAGVWTTRRSFAFAAAALVAFGIQAGVFAAYVGLVTPHIKTASCAAIFASSTLIGAASMIPGGLGAMEAAMVLQLTGRGAALPDALAAVAATRISTLWFGMVLGAVMLAGLSRTERALKPQYRS